MFICRQHFLRLHKPKHISITLSNGLRYRQHAARQVLSSYSEGLREEEMRVSSTAEGTVEEKATPGPVMEDTFQDSITGHMLNWNSQTLRSLRQLRKKDKTVLAGVPITHLLRLIRTAEQPQLANTLSWLVPDVVRLYSGDDRSIILSALLAASQVHPFFPKDRLATLVKALQESARQVDIPFATTVSIANTIISAPAVSKPDTYLITTFTPLLLEYASQPTDVLTNISPHPVAILLRFIQRLTTVGEHQKALNLLKVLLTKGFIPSNATASVDPTAAGFEHIVTAMAINTALSRGWLSQALALLTEHCDRGGTLQSDLFYVALRLAVGFIQTLERGDLERASGLIIRLLNEPKSQDNRMACVMLDRTLRLFYHQARTARQGPLMVTVYQHTRSPENRVHYSYHPPQGGTLLWFFRYTVAGHRNVQVARLLAEHIAEDEGIVIPYHDKAALVTSFALAGFSLPARRLWERYAGQSEVAGNATTMLRLVSLFANLSRRLSSKFSTKCRPVPRSFFDRKAAVRTLGDGINVFAGTLGLPRLAHGQNGLKMHEGAIASNVTSSALRCADRATEDQVRDLRGFAYRVIEAFKECHPHTHIHHHLNALARAYMILEDYHAGLKILMTVIRHHTPDIRDANVALSAISAQSAAHGATMLGRMSEAGLKPSAVSFGTVIHHAVAQRDARLVTMLLTRAREEKIGLSFETIGTVLRHYSTQDDSKNALRAVRDLVDPLLQTNSIPTPRMGMDCVTVALRARDPVTAFEFWKMLVKDRVDWDGVEQARLRRRIAYGIRRHCDQPLLGDGMVAELGGEGIGRLKGPRGDDQREFFERGSHAGGGGEG